MSAPRHTFLDSQGLPIHCLEWGDSEGAPLILVHGYLDLAESWRAFVDALQTRQRNLWVIAPDCRGHGDSGWIGAGGGADELGARSLGPHAKLVDRAGAEGISRGDDHLAP